MSKQKGFSSLFLFLSVSSIISITKQTLQSWDMIKSSAEISETKIYKSQAEFNSEIIKSFFNSSGNYLEINSKDVEAEFSQIDSFVKFDGTYYICPSGISKPHLYKYKDSLTKITTLPNGIANYSDWRVRCYYRPQAQSGVITNVIIVAFLDTKYIHWYKHYKNEWGSSAFIEKSTYFIDLFIEDNYYKEYENSHPIYYGYYFYYFNNSFLVTAGEITFDHNSEASTPFWNAVRGEVPVANKTNIGSSKVFLKKNSYTDLEVYIITYGPTGHWVYDASTSNIKSTSFTLNKSFKLPLDFSPDTAEILDFSFINLSDNYYYKVKTSSGTIYWGMGELLNNTIVFNTKDPVNKISSYKNSKRGVLVSNSTHSYFVCPYSLSSLTCNSCSDSEILFLNYLDKNYCVSASDKMDISNGIAKCKDGYLPSGSTCKTCSEVGGYNVLPGNLCELTCDTERGAIDDSTKTCTYCYSLSTPQYLYNGACVSSKPSNTYISNSAYNIIEDCNETCATCEDSSDNCLTCTGNYFKKEDENKCVTVCKDFYGKYISASLEQKCVNCKEFSMVKFFDGDTCISRPSNVPIFDVPINLTEDTNYGIIDTCHDNCESCTEKGDNNDNKCTKCKENTFLKGSICVSDCSTPKLYSDNVNRVCQNCASLNSFKYVGKDNECKTPQPAGTIVVDQEYGIIEDCDSSCAACAESPDQCTECYERTFLEYKGNKCLSSCNTTILVEDSKNKKCINCKDNPDTPYKLINSNSCSAPPDSSKRFVEIEKEFGLIEICYESCETCKGKETLSEHNCISCRDSYYLQPEIGSTNCLKTCPTNYAKDDTDHKCINCKSIGQYKYPKSDYCTGSTVQPSKTYISIIEFNVLGDCHDNCEACNGAGSDTNNNCEKCVENKVQLLDTQSCNSSCGDTKLYADFKNRKCIKCEEGKVKYIGEDNPCIIPPLTPYYTVDSNYNIIADCSLSCLTCSKGPDNDNDNCDSCKQGEYLSYRTNKCVSSCDSLYAISDNNLSCIKCSDNDNDKKYKYEDGTSCIALPDQKVQPTYIYNEDYGIIKNCYATCGSCELGPNDDNSIHNCKTCKTGYHLVNKNCISCGNQYQGILNGKCVNCKENDKVKYQSDPYCIDPPLNKAYYTIEETYGIIGDCYKDCATCEEPPNSDSTIHNCKSCSGSFYLLNKNCVTDCGLLGKTADNKCENCAQLVPPQYKTLDGEVCQSSKAHHFISDLTYNIIYPCSHDCLECENSTDTCTECPNGKFLQYNGTVCIDSCDKNILAEENNKCVNCKEKKPPQYKYINDLTCIDLPESSVQPTYITDNDYNIIANCDNSCSSCIGSPTNCISCPVSSFKQPGSTECKNSCPNYYGEDSSNQTCLKCPEHPPKSFIKDGGKVCIEEPTTPYVIKNEEFGLIEICYESCETCKGKETLSEHNCISCRDSYYLQPEIGSTNCLKTCPTNYAKDDTDNKCINCKSIGQYKYPKSDYCTGSTLLPEGTYVAESSFNILGNCYSSCQTCTSEGTNLAHLCTSCKKGYEADAPDLTFNCNPLCEAPNKWYYDNAGLLICLKGSNCPAFKNFLIESTYQCVESCLPTGTCELCKTEDLYEEGGKCIPICPNGKIKNTSKHTCDSVGALEDNGCTTTYFKEEGLLINSLSINDKFESEISNFISENQNESKNVRVIVSDEISYLIYKNNTCGYDLAMKYNLSYSNISECINILIDAGTISKNEEIIIGQIDIARKTEVANQAGYYVAKSDGTQLDLSPCNDVKIITYYPIHSNNIINFSRSSKFQEKGIDLNNPKDPFFNDFCYPFYDENGKDVTLTDRRKYFFENETLCENGCDYVQIDFKTSRIECSCEIKQTTFDKIVENIPMDDFPSGLNMQNLILVRCYNLVFNWNYIKVNYGCWILVVLFGSQLFAAMNFLIIGFGPLYSFLNQIHREKLEIGNEIQNNHNTSLPSNPPKKSHNKKNKEESEESSSSFPSQRKNTESSKLSNQILESPVPLKYGHCITNSKLPMIELTSSSSLNPKNNGKRKQNNYITTYTDKDTVVYYKDSINQIKGKNDEKPEEEPKFENDELNVMAYEDALEYDHRGFFYFYCLIFKDNMILISVFSNISVFEPFFIKLISFLLSVASYFVFNAIFFDEEYITKRYKEESTGFFYLIQNELPKCVYASIASTFISLLVNYLSNSRKRFDTLIKKENDGKQFLIKSKTIIKSMRGRILTFFIITVILMSFFWYYVSAFCSVYQKTQIAWIEGTGITFLFCVVLYSILFLFVTIMRYMGLKCHISCLYTLSTYII